MLWITTILVISCIYYFVIFIDVKTNYRYSRELLDSFTEWFRDESGTVKAPNNAIFAQLYKIVYNKEKHLIQHYDRVGSALISNDIDVVASFPTKVSKIFPTEFFILENLVDYFEFQYKELTSIRFIIRIPLFLPQKLIEYLKLSSSDGIKHFFNFIYWIFTIVQFIYGPLKELLLIFIK